MTASSWRRRRPNVQSSRRHDHQLESFEDIANGPSGNEILFRRRSATKSPNCLKAVRLGRRRDTDAGQIVLHLLVPAEETELIMDRFEQECANAKGFHVILFPVDAVLPRPNPEPEPKPKQVQEAGTPEPEEIKYGKRRISRKNFTPRSRTDSTRPLFLSEWHFSRRSLLPWVCCETM